MDSPADPTNWGEMPERMGQWLGVAEAMRRAYPESCPFRSGASQCILPKGHDGLHDPGEERWQLADRMREESIAVLERRVAALEARVAGPSWDDLAAIRAIVDRYAGLVEQYAGAVVQLTALAHYGAQ